MKPSNRNYHQQDKPYFLQPFFALLKFIEPL